MASGIAWTEQALALPGADRPTAGRAAALRTLGVLLFFGADFRASIAALQEAAMLFRGLDRWREVSRVLCALSADYPLTSRTAAGLIAEALALANETGDPWTLAWALGWQAGQAWQRGDLAAARVGWEACLAIARRVTEPFVLHWAVRNLACVATDQEDPAAGAYVAESLVNARAVGAATELVETVALAGLHALLEGRPGEAVSAAVEGLQLMLASGFRAIVDVWCLELLACAWTAQGQPRELAARLLGAAAQVREGAAGARIQRFAALVEQAGAAQREALGAAAFVTAYEAGRSLTREEAIAEALAVAKELALAAKPAPAPSGQ